MAKPSYARTKGDPTVAVRPGPDCSAVLGLCSVAPNSLRSLCSLRSNSRAKSVDEGAARPLQSPALLDATHGAQEQHGRSLREPPHASLRLGAAYRAMRSEPSGEEIAAGVRPADVAWRRQVASCHLAARPNGKRLCFGYFHLARQMKVTRPPGRNPGSGRTQRERADRDSATAKPQ